MNGLVQESSIYVLMFHDARWILFVVTKKGNTIISFFKSYRMLCNSRWNWQKLLLGNQAIIKTRRIEKVTI